VCSSDLGITYSRPLSFSRRTRFSFSTSSLAVDDGIQRYSTVGGSAVLTHEISRNWSANLSADRGISLLSGFHDPFLANGVNGALEGTFGGRFHFTSSAGYSGGNIGVARAIFHNYTSSMASARLEVELVRRLSAYTEYAFYKYRFDQQVLLPNGTPQQLDRNGVRVGVSYMVPLLRERTNSATR